MACCSLGVSRHRGELSLEHINKDRQQITNQKMLARLKVSEGFLRLRRKQPVASPRILRSPHEIARKNTARRSVELLTNRPFPKLSR